MKKTIACGMIVAMLLAGMTTSAVAAEGRGGFMGFIAGCCFGLRAAGDYNAGKEIHWREWCRLIPYAGIIFAVWDGIDGVGGKTTSQYASEYGSMFY